MNDEIKSAEETLARLRKGCQLLQEQIATGLIGQNEVVRLLLTSLVSGGPTLLIGVPGLAKTMMVQALADLLGNAKAGGKTDLGACLEQVFAQTKRRGVLAVMSDFLDADARFWKSVDLFRSSRFDVMLFQIIHPEEIDLPAVAAARFVETEGSGHFNVEPDSIRVIYRRRFDQFLSEIKANCQARGCDWYLAKTSDDPYGFLRNCFLARENGR